MESEKVLDVARHPRLLFHSTAVTVQNRHGAVLDLMIAGQLTIREVSQPVMVPVHAEISGERMTATGRLSIRQTAYAITPITVGGVVAVKDALDVSFSIVAQR